MLIENTTISDNSATGRGGGIYSYNNADNARTIRNSTVVDNVAYAGSSGSAGGGGIYEFASDNVGAGSSTDDVTLSSTIVASNSPTDLDDNGSGATVGAFVTGFSLIEDPGDAAMTESPAGSNLLGVDPQLGPLADNGGLTETLLPNLTSPVIDAGVANGLANDQRGLPRTSTRSSVPNKAGSDGTDIGADRAAGGRERPARQRRLPGCGGAVEDRHRGRRDDHRHRGL